MRIALLSDIHGNLEALMSVVEDLKSRKVDRVVCLGDMVGYGPDPDDVLSTVRALGFECILGNHEAALFNKKSRNWLNFQAKDNNIETEHLLSSSNLDFCRSLPKSLTIENLLFVHGFPPDSVLVYLENCKDQKIEKLLTSEDGYSVYFVGHTHTLSMVFKEQDGVVRQKIGCGLISLDKQKTYVINAGSLGQPRDGDNKAKYVVFDSDKWTVEIFGVEYNVDETVRKIAERGFPSVYGMRLK